MVAVRILTAIVSVMSDVPTKSQENVFMVAFVQYLIRLVDMVETMNQRLDQSSLTTGVLIGKMFINTVRARERITLLTKFRNTVVHVLGL
jgi:hypothetical protein